MLARTSLPRAGWVAQARRATHLPLSDEKIASAANRVCLFVIILHSAASDHGISHTHIHPASSVT
jgi:hypothetical protein